MHIRATILAIAAAGATYTGAAPAPAYAAGDLQHMTSSVAYGDLNLRAAAGRAELQQRIEVAARRMCNQTLGQSLAEVTHRRNCHVAAVGSAAEQAAAIAG